MRVAAALVGLAACSVAAVKGPPDVIPQRSAFDFKPIDCTDSHALPAIDTGLAVVALTVATVSGVQAVEELAPYPPSHGSNAAPIFGAAFLVATAFGASSLYGFGQVARCKRALAADPPPP